MKLIDILKNLKPHQRVKHSGQVGFSDTSFTEVLLSNGWEVEEETKLIKRSEVEMAYELGYTHGSTGVEYHDSYKQNKMELEQLLKDLGFEE